MLNITDKDEVFLQASKLDMLKIIGVLFAHLIGALGLLSLIANYVLKESFAVGVTVTVLISSVMLTSAIWIFLRWCWSRITVNGKQYRFIGKVYPLFGMIIAMSCMLIVAEAALGVGVLMLFSASYVWWQLTTVILCLTVMISCLLLAIRYMKSWVYKNIVEDTKQKESTV